jgi:hypothetical protein
LIRLSKFKAKLWILSDGTSSRVSYSRSPWFKRECPKRHNQFVNKVSVRDSRLDWNNINLCRHRKHGLWRCLLEWKRDEERGTAMGAVCFPFSSSSWPQSWSGAFRSGVCTGKRNLLLWFDIQSKGRIYTQINNNLSCLFEYVAGFTQITKVRVATIVSIHFHPAL